jgi:SAM-dependent methyltransferase
MTIIGDVRRALATARERGDQEKHRQERLRERERRIEAYFARVPAGRRLQIGAGTNLLEGWLNTDFVPGSDDVAFLDALDTFPFDDHAFECVFSEHMIEHVPYKGGLFMLSEAFRVLAPGGRIRIATPDVCRITGLLSDARNADQRRYIEWSASECIGLYSSEPSPLQRARPEWAIDPEHIRRHFPDVREDGACFVVNNFFRSFGHQFLYDARTLTASLLAAGFVSVERAEPGKSADERLAGIESHGRVIGDANNAFETIVLEAVRP